jgi:hypothetical protein
MVRKMGGFGLFGVVFKGRLNKAALSPAPWATLALPIAM